MMQMTLSLTVRRASLVVVTFGSVAVSAVGCGAGSNDRSSFDVPLDAPAWTPCAEQGEHCDFSGTHDVRYGVHGNYVVKTAQDGMHCTAQEFATAEQADARCDVAEGPAATENDLSHAHVDATTVSLEAASVPADDPHAMHAPATASTATSAGPYIDTSAIPSAEPGTDHEAIGNTSEKPGVSDGVGAFRTVCDFSHMNFDDPIVFPGQPGKAHLHAYFGNTAADAMSTADSLRDSGDSTCRGGTANRTAYWAPAVIDADGKPVKPNRLETYYKSGYNGIEPGEVQAFPSGLRMIAGDAKSTSTQTHAYWGCRANYIGHPGDIPTCPAGDEVAMVVEFPQCWDGKNLDATDHKSHMAYPLDGECPATHPVAIPAITMNVVYDNPTGSTAGWRLASDMYDRSMPSGYSAHADWFEAWDPAIAETFVENCINPGVDCKSHLLGDGRTIN
jgi:hypothetical protein